MSVGAAANKLSDTQRFDWLRLWRSENIGPRTFWSLLHRYGSAGAALAALPRLMPRGLPAKIASVEDIEREFAAAARSGARFVAMGEAEYSPHLGNIDAAPPLVAVRGNLSVFQRPAVAIVGSRNASAAGLAFAERLTRGLADAGFVIVSGLAPGIDIRGTRSAARAVQSPFSPADSIESIRQITRPFSNLCSAMAQGSVKCLLAGKRGDAIFHAAIASFPGSRTASS
jgi:DNA processing protein